VLSWEIHTYHTAQSIKVMVERNNDDALGIKSIRMAAGKPVLARSLCPSIDFCISAQFVFETRSGRGKGVVNLVPGDDSGVIWKAYTLMMSLQELKGYEENLGKMRDLGLQSGARLGRLTRGIQPRNSEPRVVIIGAGQAGLTIAARLKMLNVPALIVEQNERVGDNWRKRYES